MLIFNRPFTNPYFNIAAEEYFVKQATEDICMIWVNEQSVIIGKHQNAYAEINFPFVRRNAIPVIRRISGGGAVYHDTGNVNFTFIKKTDKTNPVDFKRFTSIIVKFMESLGIEVNSNDRNSLFVENMKFSGHAEHIFHDKVLHHGTILFNTDLEKLQNCLTPEKTYEGKALVSVRSTVGNIVPLLSETIEIEEFTKTLTEWLLDFYPGSNSYKLQSGDISAINQLVETKYKTWEWNFGYSPDYVFQINIPGENTLNIFSLKVKNGLIVQVDSSDKFKSNTITTLLNGTIGLHHREDEINKYVVNNRNVLELAGINIVNFCSEFFK